MKFTDPNGTMEISITVNSSEFEALDPDAKEMIRQLLGGVGYTVCSVVNCQDSLSQIGLSVYDALMVVVEAQRNASLLLSSLTDAGNSKIN